MTTDKAADASFSSGGQISSDFDNLNIEKSAIPVNILTTHFLELPKTSRRSDDATVLDIGASQIDILLLEDEQAAAGQAASNDYVTKLESADDAVDALFQLLDHVWDSDELGYRAPQKHKRCPEGSRTAYRELVASSVWYEEIQDLVGSRGGADGREISGSELRCSLARSLQEQVEDWQTEGRSRICDNARIWYNVVSRVADLVAKTVSAQDHGDADVFFQTGGSKLSSYQMLPRDPALGSNGNNLRLGFSDHLGPPDALQSRAVIKELREQGQLQNVYRSGVNVATRRLVNHFLLTAEQSRNWGLDERECRSRRL